MNFICNKKRHYLLRLLFLAVIAAMVSSLFSFRSYNNNSAEARKVFDHTYNMVYGPQGSTLHYDINIIGVLKTNGTIWYKGKKSRFVESRFLSWNDGVKEHWVDQKKKTVTIYDTGSPKIDKYASKFSFNRENYNYSMATTRDTYTITLEARKNVKGVKHAKVIIDRKTRAPKYLKIKVLWFWTTVNISNFKSGNVSDSTFKFPSEKYKGYTLIDERSK